MPARRSRFDVVAKATFLVAVVFGVGTMAQEPETSGNDSIAKQYSPEILCGPIALSIAARRLGIDADVDKILNLVSLTSQGCSLGDLARAAESFGLGVETYSLRSTRHLAMLEGDTSAIVQVRGNHFAVIWGTGNNDIFYADYPKKLRKVHHSAMEDTWDPRILVIKLAGAPRVFSRVDELWVRRGLATALGVTLFVLAVGGVIGRRRTQRAKGGKTLTTPGG